MRALTIHFALVLSLAACSAHAVQITHVTVERQQFDPSNGDLWQLQFELSEPAAGHLRLYDGSDVQVRVIAFEGQPGNNKLSWDGRDQSGRALPNEAYHYVIEAETASGDRAVYDLTDITGGQELTTQTARWDSETKQISFSLPRPARINVRAGLGQLGPLLRTVVDWVPRMAGEQVEAWDGKDNSGLLDLTRHPQLEIAVQAYSLPDNVIFVGTPPQRVALSNQGAGAAKREVNQPQVKKMHYHAQQPLAERGDIAIGIALPAGTPQDKDGTWVISGIVPFMLEVAPEDKQRVLDRRFEPVFFVDGSYVFENEVGFLPTTWIMDASRYPEGEHFVTANLRGYEGNFGIATVRVRIQHGEAQ
ncbi:FlgD immunoglobulin-like domain containing protein [Pseudomarimonas arenosa]|uniref:FlgD/Vpr Ig-like domain-containing protein n=1 Tax=Pseudomarimonas arenosa TaxID=2774145 RepID=A0AAW3ZU11_9GAMM|nr:FlgD immunoglobulin-like domain containing protein [Pseudomarimonas arenosa]MBD8528250.1 hypothetical protein [Pseudomarimonas arenosa]